VNPTIPAEELIHLARPALDRAGAISLALNFSCDPSAPSTLTHEIYVAGDLLAEEMDRGAVRPATLQAVTSACARGLTWLQAHAPHTITTPLQEAAGS